eukprot:870042-Prorocentrum_minimum.AAC.3
MGQWGNRFRSRIETGVAGSDVDNLRVTGTGELARLGLELKLEGPTRTGGSNAVDNRQTPTVTVDLTARPNSGPPGASICLNRDRRSWPTFYP